jgi:hypothetical protein
VIVASVRLKEPENQFKFIDEGPINVWLLANVGVHARFKDLVDEERPWHVEHNFREIVYHFAREQDATLFALRWS